MRYLLGGYGPNRGGSAEGIGLLQAGAVDSPLASGPLGVGDPVVAADSPAWLAWHPTLEVVYATLAGQDAVQAFVRDGEQTFTPLGRPVSVGPDPVHVLALPQALIVARAGDGAIARVAVDESGRPCAVTEWPAADAAASDGDDGSGFASAGADLDLAAAARALREAAGDEYAHLVPTVLTPPPVPVDTPRTSSAEHAVLVGGGLLATTDSGVDLVRFWRAQRPVGQVQLPSGSGPRSALHHPSGHLYVVAAHSAEVFALAPDRTGVWRVVAGVSLGGLPGDRATSIAVSREGDVLTVGLRGSDTVAAVRVRGAGDQLDLIALAESGVAGTTDHLVARDTLLVAGRESDEIVSLAVDTRTGAPGRVRHRTLAPTPSMILPFPV